MAKNRQTFLNFEIDKLASSIENIISGEVFDTAVSLLTTKDVKRVRQTAWNFNWNLEFQAKDRQVYKLTTVQNPGIIHGLISLSDKKDHIFMELIESADFNKGKKKLYSGVAGNLVAYACKLSFENGYDGVVSFIAKTQLIDHYHQTLGAKLFAGNRMFIDTPEALKLVKNYFKDFDYDQL